MSAFRKGGIIALVLVALCIGGAMYFLTDEFIEHQLEKTMSISNGALVEIDGLRLSILGGTMEWNRLQMTDPEHLMQNKLETGRVALDIQAWKLLQKKFIVNELTLSDITTGTPRTYPGALPEEWIPEEPEVETEESTLARAAKERAANAKRAIAEEAQKTAAFQLANTSLNADSLIAVMDLQAPAKIDSLKRRINHQVETINASVDSLNIGTSVDDIEAKLKAINVANIKDVKAAEEALKNLNQLKTTSQELKKRIETANRELTEGTKTLNSGTRQIDDWIKEDYLRAQQLAKLPDFDSQKIGELLMGKEFMSALDEYMGYAETARKYLANLPKSEEKVDKPERYKGQDIRFPEREANPSLWIKAIQLSVNTSSNIRFTGTVTDVVNNQSLIGTTTKLTMTGKNELGESMNVKGELNYLGSEPVEQVEFTMPSLSLRTLNLGGGGSLPNGFERGNGAVKAALLIRSGVPNAHIRMDNTNVVFRFSGEAKGRSEQTFRSIMGRINTFYVEAKVSGKGNGVAISVDSDIDERVSREVKAVANAEVEKAKRDIQNKIDAQVNAKKRELNAQIDQQRKQLETKKNQLEARVNEQLSAVEKKKKELEDKKDELVKKGTDAVKDAVRSRIRL